VLLPISSQSRSHQLSRRSAYYNFPMLGDMVGMGMADKNFFALRITRIKP